MRCTRGSLFFRQFDGLHSQTGVRRMREAISRELSCEGILLSRPVSCDDLCSVDVPRRACGTSKRVLNAVQPKLYHAGFRGRVSKSTLSDANRRRDWRIYADFAQVLIRSRASVCTPRTTLGVALKHAAYALDSTTIDLCLALFPWARFRRRKGAVKLHTLIDLRGNIPCFIRITHGKTADVNVLDHLPIEPGAFYMMDRGYIDFARLYAITRQLAFFVTRAKRNIDCSRRESRMVDKSTGLRSDQTIVLPRSQDCTSLSDSAAPRCLLRRRTPTATGISDQQLRASSTHDCTTLSMSLAGRTILQVDQTELADQGVLRPLRQRSEGPRCGSPSASTYWWPSSRRK